MIFKVSSNTVFCEIGFGGFVCSSCVYFFISSAISMLFNLMLKASKVSQVLVKSRKLLLSSFAEVLGGFSANT